MPSRSSSVTVVIPARFGSSRFPGKPLAQLMGKPLIQHVYERVQAAPGIGQVLVATDDRRISEAVQGFGGAVVLTGEPFRTGTDRVAGVARQLPGDVFVNLQGDEIALHPGLLTDLVTPFLTSGAAMGTLKRRLTSADELRNPGVVKVVTDRNGEALYFSRAPIPHVRDGKAGEPVNGLHYVHLGIYIYTRDTLLRLAGMPTGMLEEAEKLEQLRAMEQGIRIRVWETSHASLRIDTPEDLDAAAAALQKLVPC
ncbi:MAG: 3-deoxy-manno-octulosonate cytidylyltransferase [Nitrospirae bacterium]|nr:3-deoxy-manno-octulosonate cytidylyltransferase [Nitrospirota bacterium]